jgi:ABC-2 type transport system permease protein
MSAMGAFAAQVEAETYMTLRRGETLLLTVGIPVAFLVFFSTVHVVPTGGEPAVSFLVPGILSLAVMSTAMVSLGIATGFERGYGVLKRLGATPLGRPRLLGAKIVTILLVEGVQAAILVPVGYGLGWHPAGHDSAGAAGEALAAVVLATVAFGGLGLVLAGVLRAEVNLAATNGLYLVLLLVGGMVFSLDKLPGGLADAARALPAAALSDALHAALGAGGGVPVEAWVVLAVWAVAAPTAAALTFRWE